jgi:imidazolonepropionase-like amidohydrolase
MAKRPVICGLLIAAVLVAAACSGATGATTGRVKGRLNRDGVAGPILLLFENLQTETAVTLVVPDRKKAFSVRLDPGSYQAWGWSPDYARRARVIDGSGVSQGADPPAATIEVAAGAPVNDLVIGGWEDRPGAPLVIRGRLIDGRGGEPVEDGVIIIREERIVAVGPSPRVAIPAGATVIELPDATVLPGLINAHVHEAYREMHLRLWAREGVTTVRDLGWDLGYDYFTARDRLARDPANARIVAAGPIVTVPGGYPIVFVGMPSLTVTSPEDVRAKIGQLIDDGADVIKITIAPGAGPCLSRAEAAAIVETAHARGIPVSAHATSAGNLERALDAGVDDIAHMAVDPVSDATIDRMVAAGVGWVPTLEVLDDSIRQHNGTENLRRFVAAGGLVALGDDGAAGVGMPLRELEHMRDAGMTPMEVIVAATRGAARVCRLDGALGTLEVGKLADVLVVAGDPLTDLQALTHVQLVVHGGEIIRDERGR